MKPSPGTRRGGIGGSRWLMVAAVALAVALSSSGVFAQNRDLRSLLDRLERLERDIRTLNLQLSRGAARPATAPPSSPAAAPPSGDSPAFARLEVRLTAMEEELRAVTGREERLAHRLDQINSRLDKLVGDVDFRLGALERALESLPAGPQGAAGGPQASAAPSPPAVARAGSFATKPRTLGTISERDLQGETSARSVARATVPGVARPQPSVLPEGTSAERYRFAFGLLRQARYDKAEQALRAFLQVHGEDPLAVNARYWLGETYYVRGEYALAAEVFLSGFQKDPKSNKAPDTLLKLGMALANLDKKREACAAFDKLQTDFPEASVSIKNTMQRQRRRSECK